MSKVIWKVAIGVFIGAISAVVAIYAVYHFAVEIPRAHEAHRAAARRLLDADIDQRGFDAVTRLTTDQLELQLKQEDTDSPCNELKGEQFALCASHDGKADQQKTVEQFKKLPPS